MTDFAAELREGVERMAYMRRNWERMVRRVQWQTCPIPVGRARDVLLILHKRGALRGLSAEAAAEAVAAWKPATDGLTLAVAEREVAYAIYRGEPGTEDMVCPPAWRESFEAGEELLRRYDAVPEPELAAFLDAEPRAAADDDEAYAAWFDPFAEKHGLTQELFERAVGPDAEEVPEEHERHRLDEYLAPLYTGDKGWRITLLRMPRKENV